MDDDVKYPHNVLEGFANGCIMDARMRMAIDLLKYSPMFERVVYESDSHESLPYLATVCAEFALSIAEEMFSQGRKRGWVEDLPEHAELDGQLRLQAKRTAGFQVAQQLEGQRIAQDEQGRVVPIASH